jgi:hypothetical protein
VENSHTETTQLKDQGFQPLPIAAAVTATVLILPLLLPKYYCNQCVTVATAAVVVAAAHLLGPLPSIALTIICINVLDFLSSPALSILMAVAILEAI